MFYIMIFGTEARRKFLKSRGFFDPNVFKIMMCITPPALVLLVVTARNIRQDVEDHNGDLKCLYGGLILDLFDAIEALTILISPEDPSDPTSHINQVFIISAIVVTAIGLFFSPLELAERQFDNFNKGSNLVKTIFVNIALFCVRLFAC